MQYTSTLYFISQNIIYKKLKEINTTIDLSITDCEFDKVNKFRPSQSQFQTFFHAFIIDTVHLYHKSFLFTQTSQ